MNIAILHCHFERGGVTQVVENHVRWLRNSDRVERIALVSGPRTSGLSEETRRSVESLIIPGFDYDEADESADSIDEKSRQVLDDLSRGLDSIGFTADDTVLHWHNHSLGKNTATPRVIRLLAQAGYRLLLQIHDFAEDNRPQNYQRLIEAAGAHSKAEIDAYLYPVAPQIHYATLTGGDADVLSRVGVGDDRTHCLPNSVVLPRGDRVDQDDALKKVRQAMQLPDDARWCVYPVRGIRRKNLGEFLLVSRWTGADCFSGMTLCPATEVEKRSYQRWRQLADEVAPRMVFDAGHAPTVTLGDNLSASDFVISTSVAEGFGMAFLEPWLVDRPVIARDLPLVTSDFEAAGVQLPCLYDSIPIPGDKTWLAACRGETHEAMLEAWSALSPDFHPVLQRRDAGGEDSIDFAKLTPRRQIEVLRRLSTDAGYEASVMDRSTTLVQNLSKSPDETIIQSNRDVVQTHYAPESTGGRLLSIYQSLVSESIDRDIRQPEHAGFGVDLVNQKRPFFPCRTEWLDESSGRT